MNRLYYAAKSLLSRAGFSVLIIIELTLLLTAANIAQAQHNSRTMLYDPYAPYISSQGFVCNLPMNEIDTLKALPGAKVLEEKQYTDSSLGLDIIVLPDDVFDKLRLPVQSGKLFDSTDRSENVKLIVTPNAEGYWQDMTFTDSNNISFEISAVLTDPTYVPRFPYSIGMSYEDFYFNYDSEYYVRQPYLFTCESMMTNAGADLYTMNIAMVCFEDEMPEEEYLALERDLNETGISTIQNRTIEKRSRQILKDDFKRSMPPVAAFSVIVFIGLVSCSLMITKSMLHKLAVFYCSGATKADCIIISILQMLILMLCAAVLSAVALIIINSRVIANKIGFVFRASNLTLSGLIIAACILISLAAPLLMIPRTDPRELLTGTRDE